MNSTWQQFLTEQGAIVNGFEVTNYGNAEAERSAITHTNILVDLSHLALLEMRGADAVTFLQKLVTNDVTLLNGSNAHYTGYCSPKGRLLVLFLAFALTSQQQPQHVHLQFNRELLEPILKRLKMYVLRAKVDIKDASDSLIHFGIHGAEAASILAKLFANVPSQDYELCTFEHATLLKLPAALNHARFEIFADEVNAKAIWTALKQHCTLAGKASWDWLEIQAGIPDVVLKTQEQFVPQMLNLDVLNAINFKKGCYTGQEIVARTHYLGKVKRRTFLAAIESDLAPEAGDVLLDANGQDAGQLVRVSPNLNNGYDVLAELRIEAQQSNSVYWQTHLLVFKETPYSLALAGD